MRPSLHLSVIVGTLVIAGSLMAGCLGGFGEDHGCTMVALRLETVHTPRYVNLGAEASSFMPVLAGEEHGFRSSNDLCDGAAPGYRWVVATSRGLDFQGYREAVVTSTPETVLHFPYPGAYDVWVDHLERDGTVRYRGDVEPPLHVSAYLYHNATVDALADAQEVAFTSFCCPYRTSVGVEQMSGVATNWMVTLSVQSSREVLWESVNGGAFGPEIYYDALGTDFLEDFVIEARPLNDPASDVLPAKTRLRIVIGPGEP